MISCCSGMRHTGCTGVRQSSTKTYKFWLRSLNWAKKLRHLTSSATACNSQHAQQLCGAACVGRPSAVWPKRSWAAFHTSSDAHADGDGVHNRSRAVLHKTTLLVNERLVTCVHILVCSLLNWTGAAKFQRSVDIAEQAKIRLTDAPGAGCNHAASRAQSSLVTESHCVYHHH